MTTRGATGALRWLRAAGATAALAACTLGGCTCSTKSKELGSIDEAGVKAKVVRVDVKKLEFEGGPHFVALPAIDHHVTHTLVVDAPISARLWMHDSCQTDFEFDVDEKGERLALRCAGGPWRMAYLGRGDRAFWGIGEIEGESVDFGAVPSFEAAAADLLVARTYAAKEGAMLVEELDARGGDLLRDTLIATVERASGPRPTYDRSGHDTWVTGLDALEGDAASAVSAALTKAFLKPTPERLVVARFARRGVVDAETRAAMVRLVEAVIPGPDRYDPHRLELGLLLRRAAREDPQALAPLACRALPRLHRDAVVVLAVAPAPCPEVSLDADRVCRARSKCGDTVAKPEPTVGCSEASMRALARARLDEDVTSDAWLGDELEVWAALQQAGSDAPLQRARRRAGYALESKGRSCWDTPLGEPCVCSFSATDAVCAGEEAELAGSRCRVVVDDAGRRITVTSLGPEPAGSSAPSASARPSASVAPPAPSHTVAPN